jgi:hypothetical protein
LRQIKIRVHSFFRVDGYPDRRITEMADAIQECGRCCPGKFAEERQPFLFPGIQSPALRLGASAVKLNLCSSVLICGLSFVIQHFVTAFRDANVPECTGQHIGTAAHHLHVRHAIPPVSPVIRVSATQRFQSVLICG